MYARLGYDEFFILLKRSKLEHNIDSKNGITRFQVVTEHGKHFEFGITDHALMMAEDMCFIGAVETLCEMSDVFRGRYMMEMI